MPDDPARIGELLGAVTSRLGVRDAGKTGAIWAQWADLVGEAVAAHAEPTSLREGVLRIRADSPAWASEIGFLAGEIAARINAALRSEVVGEIRVWTGPRRDRPARKTSVPPPSAATPKAGQKKPPTDPEEALLRAREAWKTKRGKGSPRSSSRGSENLEKPW
ncbi:MAG: DUF721 domain-containing protein [Actinomycetota bacterium]|nr:DUF721 domain-containing protein [Actinomycetota bacterium]